jgi:hypothetical protein
VDDDIRRALEALFRSPHSFGGPLTEADAKLLIEIFRPGPGRQTGGGSGHIEPDGTIVIDDSYTTKAD